jgi:tetratricopeptide (TPR) repeat protein
MEREFKKAMINREELIAIIDRLLNGQQTPSDLEQLRQSLSLNDNVVQWVSQEGKFNTNIGQITGGEIHLGDRIYQGTDAQTLQKILTDTLKTLPNPNPGLTSFPHNLPRSGVLQFIGRDSDLTSLHQLLQDNDQISICAITGMGGIGKTELALQYALLYKSVYIGGICWLRAKALNIGIQIVQFGRSCLQLHPPEELDLMGQVEFCWTHWLTGEVLIIIDDVVDYAAIKPYLPPVDSRFKVLLTSRLRLGKSIKQLDINVLDESAAFNLLASLIGSERIELEKEQADKLCRWLGYLPLGLELVGRYLDRKPDLELVKIQQQLERKKLQSQALDKRENDADMTASLGVLAAFELSWETLEEPIQQLGAWLSLFALAPIPWSLVEQYLSEYDSDELEERRDVLLDLHLIQRKGKELYQFHQLIREFWLEKLEAYPNTITIKQKFCQTLATIAQQFPENPTHDFIQGKSSIIPHIVEVATTWKNHLSDSQLLPPFEVLGQLYENQGFYQEACHWYEQCLTLAEERFSQQHLDVAKLRDYLAYLYRTQARHEEAEVLCKQALEIRQNLLDKDDPLIADSLNQLGLVYSDKGNYLEAKKMYKQALEIVQKSLDPQHFNIANYITNLANLYLQEQQYNEAESLYQQAIKIYEKHQDNLYWAVSLNNLARLYDAQENYIKAEPLYQKALELFKTSLGEEHPDIATCLSNLAFVYAYERKLEEAETMYIQSLEMQQKILGNYHPNVAFTLNDLAGFYQGQQRYSEALKLYQQALAILEDKLGKDHPYTIKIFDNICSLNQKMV